MAFRRVLKENEGTSKYLTSVTIYESTGHNIAEESDLWQHRCKNFQSQIKVFDNFAG
jgi:hypothetical protein